MKLSGKIQQLRKTKNLTQEALAELCHVSRQAVAKWELGQTIPEISTILCLSRIFNVTTDILLKEELEIDNIANASCCQCCPSESKQPPLYSGILIKESIDDENVIDLLHIHKVELWRTEGKPKYWTALTFTSSHAHLPQRLAEVMIKSDIPGESWFADFSAGKIKYIVFRDTVLHYTIGNMTEKAAVYRKMREWGIPDSQMHWPE